MNIVYAEAAAAELATLTRIVGVPVEDSLGYGRDLACITDLDPRLAEVDPMSPGAITQAVIRRFITPRTGLIDDADYGLDVRAHCNRGVTLRDLRALAGAMQGEAQKDDRVATATVIVTASSLGQVLSMQVEIVPADPALAEFSFTFAVTDASVLMVTING